MNGCRSGALASRRLETSFRFFPTRNEVLATHYNLNMAPDSPDLLTLVWEIRQHPCTATISSRTHYLGPDESEETKGRPYNWFQEYPAQTTLASFNKSLHAIFGTMSEAEATPGFYKLGGPHSIVHNIIKWYSWFVDVAQRPAWGTPVRRGLMTRLSFSCTPAMCGSYSKRHVIWPVGSRCMATLRAHVRSPTPSPI